MTDDYAEQLRRHRAEKDEILATHRQSPIPPEQRDSFDGLAYFDPDESYRVEATGTVHDDPDIVEMDTSEGRVVRYREELSFEATVDGEAVTFHGYRQEADDEIFVPFRDKTTGQQTYEGGRYMELTPEEKLEDGDTVTVDFNLAYAPFCAFSDTFDCPLAPEENWLDVAIEAGERNP